MKKTVFVTLIAMILFFAFSFGSVFANNTNMANDAMNTVKNGANGVRNVVGGVENGIENVARDITGDDNTKTTMTNNTTTNRIGTATTTHNTNNTNYTADRTSTTANSRGAFDMNNNTITWVVLAITGVGIVVLLWAYFSQNKTTNHSDYE